VNSAIRFLDADADRKGILPLTKDVVADLKKLHPDPGIAPDNILKKGKPTPLNPIIFEAITGDSIRITAMRTKGSAGISGRDSEHWRRLLFSFGDVSIRLADALAAMARRICTQYLDPDALSTFLANRLIPLNKDPGVRPIGIGEVPRRIIPLTPKVVMSPIGDITE